MQKEEQIEIKDIIKTIQNYLNYFNKKKYFILLFSLAFAMLISYINKKSEDSFTANLTFIIEEDSAGNPLSSMSNIASSFGVNIGGTNQSILVT